MTWPAALTTNADILRHVFEQGITRMLEPSIDYTALHEGTATEVRLWLEAHGTPEADRVINFTDFTAAAAHLFFAKLIRSRDPGLSELYTQKFLAIMRSTRPELQAPDTARSGVPAKIVVIRQGASVYTSPRSGAVFPSFRGPRT
jgi:hypothetical protein